MTGDLPGKEAAREVQKRVGPGWVIWYGPRNDAYWAMPRQPFPGRPDGWIESKTPVGLAARIDEVNAFYR